MSMQKEPVLCVLNNTQAQGVWDHSPKFQLVKDWQIGKKVRA